MLEVKESVIDTFALKYLQNTIRPSVWQVTIEFYKLACRFCLFFVFFLVEKVVRAKFSNS